MPRQTTFHRRLAGSAIPIFMVLAWVGCAAHCLHGAEMPDSSALVTAGQVRIVPAEHDETCGIVASPMIAADRRLADDHPVAVALAHRSVEIAGHDRCVSRASGFLQNDSIPLRPDLYILLQNFRT